MNSTSGRYVLCIMICSTVYSYQVCKLLVYLITTYCHGMHSCSEYYNTYDILFKYKSKNTEHDMNKLKLNHNNLCILQTLKKLHGSTQQSFYLVYLLAIIVILNYKTCSFVRLVQWYSLLGIIVIISVFIRLGQLLCKSLIQLLLLRKLTTCQLQE